MRRQIAIATAASVLLLLPTGVNARPDVSTIREFRVSERVMRQIRSEWMNRLLAEHPARTWAPMKVDLSDEMLRKLGLPPAKVLRSRRYPEPTIVTPDGKFAPIALPTVTTYAGAGWFGIRPGAWLLLLDGGGVGWCSLAHVYGSPGAYDISTAGHCGKTGDTATVIAAFGNRGGLAGPVLLDFGSFATSHDGGLGADWALIDIEAQHQSLVTPTMAFWGGPRGMYTPTGSLVDVEFRRRNFIPSITVDPNPFLAQAVVHYGHGLGVGTAGTARAGSAISWDGDHYMFFGAIAPGDSGSGTNTLTGDTAGATMEAAGINTHLWIDPLMRSGLGIMAGTRATKVSGTLANGQLVAYPVPAPMLP